MEQYTWVTWISLIIGQVRHQYEGTAKIERKEPLKRGAVAPSRGDCLERFAIIQMKENDKLLTLLFFSFFSPIDKTVDTIPVWPLKSNGRSSFSIFNKNAS